MPTIYSIPKLKGFRQLDFKVTSSSNTPSYKSIPTPNIVSNDEKIDTKDLKVGDKVWIEVEVDMFHRIDNIFWFNGTPFHFSQIKKIIPKI